MLTNTVSDAICNLFTQVCDQNMVPADNGRYFFDNDFVKSDDVAMHFVVEVSAENHGYEIDGNTKRGEWERLFHADLHILITANKNVFVGVCNKGFSKVTDIPLTEWKNPSNHDTCWRTDGVEASIKEMSKKAWEHSFGHVPTEHLRDRDVYCGVDMRLSDRFDRVVGFVRIKHEYDGNGRRKITAVKPLTTVITFKEE